jgi:peptide alpha-N-acetyltransferase
LSIFSLSTAAVVKHFDDIHEDQFDFHSYCIRKVTLRAYTDVLKFEDSVWGEEYYFEAAEGTIRIYLQLYDHPIVTEEEEEPDYSKMTAAQKKKAKAIARKKRAQAEKKEAEKMKTEGKTPSDNGGQKKKGDKISPVEEDPEGTELLKKDPLDEARKYSSILSKHCPKRFGTWVLQYDVSIRRKKPLLALQALFKMRNLDPSHALYIPRLVDFAVKSTAFDVSGPVKNVIMDEIPTLLGGMSVSEFVVDLAKKARDDPTTSLPNRIATSKCLVLTKSESTDSAAKIIVDGGIDGRGVTVESCREALTVLKGLGTEASNSTEKWLSIVKERFPLIKDFS